MGCLNCPGSVSTSRLLATSTKMIKISKDRIVATNGPNVLVDLDLCGLNIPYDQVFRSQIRIPKNSANVSLQYENALGLKTTFVAIKATYDPKNKILDDNHLTYFFKGEADLPRYMGKLMILTGTETAPIPPVYLTNESNYDVVVDVMAATTFVDFEESASQVVPGSMSFYDVLWTDLLSDPQTGDLIIYSQGAPVAYINLDEIVSVELNGRIILIDDRSIGEYTIVFKDDFNANQANSLIQWVMADRTRRITLGMSADTTAPVVTFTPNFSTTIILDNYATTSGGVSYLITKQDLIALWIQSVVDNRDGVIIMDDSNITITPVNSVTPVNAITDYGHYSIVIQVEDAARNLSLDTFVLNVKDLVAPKIILNSYYSQQISSGFLIGDPNYPAAQRIWVNDYSLSQINKQNLIDLFIAQVIDNHDGNIPLHVENIAVTIQNNLNQSINTISTVGTYIVYFTVTDSDGNSSNLLWKDINTQQVDQFNNVVTSFSFYVSVNQAPVVTFRSPLNPISLYQFNINGIINKSDLLTYLVTSVTDDRTPSVDILFVQSQIFDQMTSSELVFINATGSYNFLVQYQDGDGKIGTGNINFTVV